MKPGDRSHRTQRVTVRFTPEEIRVTSERAHECGRPVSTYMREVSLGSVPRARPHRIEKAAVYELGRIGNNLNQLAHIANTTGRLDDARRLEVVTQEVLKAIRCLV